MTWGKGKQPHWCHFWANGLEYSLNNIQIKHPKLWKAATYGPLLFHINRRGGCVISFRRHNVHCQWRMGPFRDSTTIFTAFPFPQRGFVSFASEGPSATLFKMSTKFPSVYCQDWCCVCVNKRNSLIAIFKEEKKEKRWFATGSNSLWIGRLCYPFAHTHMHTPPQPISPQTHISSDWVF